MPLSSRSGLLVVSVIVLILAAVFAGCSSPNAPAPAPTTPPLVPASPAPAPAGTTQPSAPAAPAGGTAAVTIQNFAFSPAALTVPAGTAVTWTNQDGPTHQIAADNGAPTNFFSKALPTGASYQFTFTSPGTYAYHCAIHPSMKGTIVVT